MLFFCIYGAGIADAIQRETDWKEIHSGLAATPEGFARDRF
ncbi:hypothetical protein D881_04905 [Corynebacterium ulcerans NCTC 12077]|nr:hypothetical protein D881_04905 [Corynebacterium ulcerans NCTC 12077]